jgi:ABC-type nitrate/sulfonate/bicarbonate transport system substrate-binding protein
MAPQANFLTKTAATNQTSETAEEEISMAPVFRHSYSNSGAVNAVFTLAQERGFYANHGLEVELVEYPRTSDALDAAIGREVDAATCPGVCILRQALAGKDPVNVMNMEDENVFGLIGARSIESPADLVGTTVGTFGLGDQNQVVISRALRALGLDPARDVRFRTDYPDRAALLAAVDRGEISAMCMTVPTPLMARAMGLPILLDFRDRAEPYQCGAIVTSRRYADENPETLTRFIAATIDGAKLFQSDVEAALPHLAARSKLTDENVLREVHCLFCHALDHLTPTVAPLAGVATDMEAMLGGPLNVDLESLVDTSYLAAAGLSR